MKPDAQRLPQAAPSSPTFLQKLKASWILLVVLALIIVWGMSVYFLDFAAPHLRECGEFNAGLLLVLLFEWLCTRFLPTILLVSATMVGGIYLFKFLIRR